MTGSQLNPLESIPRSALSDTDLSVLHVVPWLRIVWGGTSPIARGLAHAQQALGIKTAVWSLDDPADAKLPDFVSAPDYAHISHPPTRPVSLGYSWGATRWSATPEASAYDILHQHGLWSAFYLATNRWRDSHDRPTIVAPQGSLDKIPLSYSRWKKAIAYRLYVRKNLTRAACLQATHEREAQSFREFGLTNPIAVIPNGVPESWLTEVGNAERFRSVHSIPRDLRILLFLSRLHPIKGPDLLLDAIASLRDRFDGWIAVIAGPNDFADYREELEMRVKRLGITHLVRFVGPQYDGDKADAFAAAELFVHPTRSDCFAIVVSEALGAGVPTLTTQAAPWGLLEEEGCGWWVPADAGAIADGIAEATRCSTEHLQEMGRQGARIVAANYTWSTIARKTAVLYAWLLGRADRPEFVLAD